jgi:uncharacterized membrane protein (UPF0127 family)
MGTLMINDIFKSEEVLFADTFVKRLKGFMFVKKPYCEALIISPCSSVHTFFMKFNIDVLFVNKNDVIVDVFFNVPKRKILSSKSKTLYIIEAPAFSFSNAKVGNRIILAKSNVLDDVKD